MGIAIIVVVELRPIVPVEIRHTAAPGNRTAIYRLSSNSTKIFLKKKSLLKPLKAALFLSGLTT